MKYIFAFVLAFLVFVPAASATVAIGEAAPDFTLPASDGSTQSLSSLRGKTVVLEWYNKGCPFVRKHYDSGNMQALQKTSVGKDIVWLTIVSSAPGKQGYMTAPEAEANKVAEAAYSSFVLLDSEGQVGRLYSAKTTPHMFVIDSSGVLAYAGAIDDKPSADKSDIVGAHNYVSAVFAAIQAGMPVDVSSTQPYGCSIKYKD